MIILDTNVMSALLREPPDGQVVSWLDQQLRTSIWTTSISIFEVQFGLEIMAAGKRRSSLVQTFQLILESIDHRVAVFDATAAYKAAELSAMRRKKGQPVEMRDTMIAGIALAHRAFVATGNTSHFQDLVVQVINPWAT